MPRYEISAPDGTRWEITAPDGATESEVLAYAKEQWAAGQSKKQSEPQAGVQPPEKAPYAATLDERQAKRMELKSRLQTLEQQIQELEAARSAVQMEDYSQLDQSIAALRREQKALVDEIKRTGVGSTGRMVGSTIGGVLGGVTGAVAGSAIAPVKGTLAGAMAGSAAGTALGSGLGTAWDLSRADPVTEEEAKEFIRSNVIEDVIWDVGGNIVLVGAGKVLKLARTPGLADRLRKEIGKETVEARAAIAAKMRDAATKEAFDPYSQVPGREAVEEARNAAARETAVRELSDRARGVVPTEGQVRGKAGFKERVVRALQADKFDDTDAALEQAAKGMHEDFVRPYGQPDRHELGQLVLRQAQSVEDAVKKRTGPVFEAAKAAGVEVDFTPVVKRLEAALAEDTASANRVLKPAERKDLEGLLQALLRKQEEIIPILGPGGKPGQSTPSIKLSAGGAFDFISGNKGRLRDASIVEKPGRYYAAVLNDLNELADKQALDAIQQVGGRGLKEALLGARSDYRNMIASVYDGAVQQALNKRPEDVGRLFWQNGNVTEVQDLQKLIKLGLEEKTITRQQALALNDGMMRGFLAEAVPDLKAAAKWSDTLKSNPLKADTFAALQSAPGMEKLGDGMRVLEQAAQVALTKNEKLTYTGAGYISNLPARVTIGLTFGFISTPAAALFGAVEGWSMLMAKALSTKNQGMFKNALVVLRASASDNPKTAAAARPAAIALVKWIKSLNDPELESKFDFGEGQPQGEQ
jgi:hypothetical protein